MTWSDPEAAKVLFETDDLLTEGNIATYLLDNLLAIGHPLDYAAANVDVVSTAAETLLYSKVIPGGSLGANGALRLLLLGNVLANAGTSDAPTLRVKFGGATQLADVVNITNGTTVSASRYPWRLAVRVANKGATNSQLIYAELTSTNIQLGGAMTTGIGDFNGNAQRTGHASNTAAIDTTADQTLQVTVQWSAANANNSWLKQLGVLLLARN